MIVSDDPIEPDKDRLGRRAVAKRWAVTIEKAQSPSGLVFALTGPWGSGKTSMLKMIEEDLRAAGRTVIDFNPWLFAGTDQLVTVFLDEIASEFEMGSAKAKSTAKRLQKYGTLLSPLKAIPVVGSTVGAISDLATAGSKALQSGGVSAQRKSVEESLREFDDPIVVFIDDLDRLTGQEIRDMLKMVRLTAAFPNMIYVLAFDRSRVEKALDEDGLPGRAYLEKIVQVIFTVPHPSGESLREVLYEELNAVFSRVVTLRYANSLFTDIYAEILRPLIKNIRDVRRYVASLESVLHVVEDQIEAADLLALEAIRVFIPDAYDVLPRCTDGLTTVMGWGNRAQESPALKSEVETFIESSSEFGDVLKSVCRRLFPAGFRHIGGSQLGSGYEDVWLKARRVAARDVLAYYLHQDMPEGLSSARLTETAFTLLEDEEQLGEFFDNLDVAKLEDVIQGLERFEQEFSAVDPTVAVVVLFNQMTRMRTEPKRRVASDPEMVIMRVLLRMLRALTGPDAVLPVVDAALSGLESLSAQYALLRLVGHRNSEGASLISRSDWLLRERDLRAKVRGSEPDLLANEAELFRLLLWAAMPAEPEMPAEEKEQDIPSQRLTDLDWCIPDVWFESAQFGAALIFDSYNPSYIFTSGSRHIHENGRLSWDSLVRICNGENNVNRCKRQIESALGSNHEMVKLIDKYLSGWRPERS